MVKATRKALERPDSPLATATPPRLEQFVKRAAIAALIRTAIVEDLGPRKLDVTSQLMIRKDQAGQAVMRSRQAGRLAGAVLLPLIARAFDAAIQVEVKREDGGEAAWGDVVAHFGGPLRSILAMERTALNLVCHLSGIATLTSRYVAAIEGTKAKICDTRKTIPGMRGLEKYAVACGGGLSHRVGLYDAVLVKDNHIAHVPLAELGTAVGATIAKARAMRPAPKFVEVEVESVVQLEKVLLAGPDIVLLDNMAPEVMRTAVEMRDRLAPAVLLEASGGVKLETVRGIAETGVDRISVGALTHSAPALDLALDIQ